MDACTKAVAQYIEEKCMSISAISQKTGIPRGILYRCFDGRRKLRADEFMKICEFLEIDPRVFDPQNGIGIN